MLKKILGLCWLLCCSSALAQGQHDSKSTLRCPTKTGGNTLFWTGFSQEKIDPSQTIPMGGYGTYFLIPELTRQNSWGVHDSLFATALWLEQEPEHPLAIVALDLVGLSSRLVERVQKLVLERLHRPGLQLVLTATHNHQSPDVLGLWGAIPFSGRNEAYMKFLENQIVHAVELASQSARCAVLSWSRTQKNTSWHEQLAITEDVEQVLTLVAQDPTDMRILGSITQWGAHPTMLSGANRATSSDFPGVFRHILGQTWPGIHLYVNGMLGGSHVPVTARERRPDPFVNQSLKYDPAVLVQYEQLAFHGYDLAQRVLKAWENQHHVLQQSQVRAATVPVDIPVDNQLFRLAEKLGMIEDRRLDREFMASKITWMQVGEMQWVTIPGEMFPGGVQELHQLFQSGPENPLMILGIGNDWAGYLMQEDEYRNNKNRYHRSLSPHSLAARKIIEGYRILLNTRKNGANL